MSSGVSVERNIGLDLLRGLSMLYIVGFWHMLGYVDPIPDYDNLVTYRLTLVVLGTFVLLSGYLVGWRSQAPGRTGIVHFYKTRLLRIYPLYLIALLIFGLLDMASVTTLVKAAFCVSMVWKPAPPTLWFITMLMLLYVAAPLLLLAIEKLGDVKFAIICVSTFIILFVYSYTTRLLDDKLLLYFPAFVFGLSMGCKGTTLWGRWFGPWGFAAVGAGIGVSFIRTRSDLVNYAMYMPMVVLGACWLLGAAKGMVSASAKATRATVFLSYASYCMYLFHRPFYVGLKTMWFPQTVAWQVVYLSGFCLPCIVLASFLLQKGYDLGVGKIAGRRSDAGPGHLWGRRSSSPVPSDRGDDARGGVDSRV